MERPIKESELEKETISMTKKIWESFRDGLAHKITKTAFIVGGAVAPFSLWIGNPNMKPINGKNIFIPIITCSVSAYLGNLVYNIIHYCFFDLRPGPKPHYNGKTLAGQRDDNWRDAEL